MQKADHLSLLVTAGDGPAECNQAVGHILDRMQDEAEMFGLSLSVHRAEGKHGPRSAVAVVHGPGRQAFATSWVGTIQWRMQSQLRQHHKRANWFVGVFTLAQHPGRAADIRPADVTFSTLRAGGPGGQHQNTTDSAVRAVHKSSGLRVVVREARSQHRNKALALERLQSLADAQQSADQEMRKNDQNKLHHALERGNPVRRFVGERFKEDVRDR
ncbi:peptide chain release factor H [Yoonia sp. BS5-3]|uniref:Peptide chain release factor H n=1 Tax=Yoonia phaeophyticola TaxID=3137369 RepID=A0ABZ2V1N5_9RHOB